MTPGKWKVTMQFINGEKKYAVYRLKDVNAVDHSGNRQYATPYTSDEQYAETVAENLNNLEEG